MKVRERRRLEHSLAALAPQLVRKYFHPSPPPTLPLGRRICLIRVVFSIKLYSQLSHPNITPICIDLFHLESTLKCNFILSVNKFILFSHILFYMSVKNSFCSNLVFTLVTSKSCSTMYRFV